MHNSRNTEEVLYKNQYFTVLAFGKILKYFAASGISRKYGRKKFFFQNRNGKNFRKYLEIRKQNYSSSEGNSQFRNISKDLCIKKCF